MNTIRFLTCMLCMWVATAITTLAQNKVTFPTQGEKLYRDEVVAIKWDKSAFQGDTVTIVIVTAYDFPGSSLVGRDISNDGQVNWKVSKGNLPTADTEFELRIYGSVSGMAVVVVNVLPPRANPAPDADAEPVVTPPTPTPVAKPTNSLETVSIGTVVKVGWASKTNSFYRVEKSTNALTSWKQVELVIGTGEPMERTFDTDGGNAFFRVVKLGSVPDMTQVTTVGVQLVGANLTNSIFAQAVWSGGTAEGSTFDGSDFTAAQMWWIDLHHTSLMNVKMQESTWAFCNFTESDFTGADGKGSTFLMSNFTGAKGLMTDGAKFYNCVMPDGSTRNDPMD